LGVFAVYVSIITILGSVVAGRYDYAIPLPKEDRKAGSLLVLSLLVITGSTAILALIVGSAGKTISDALNLGLPSNTLWLLPIGILAFAVYQSFSFWAIRNGTFGVITRARLSQAVIIAGSQVAFGWWFGGPVSVVGGDSLGRIGGAGRLAKSVAAQVRAQVAGLGGRELREVAGRYRRFPMLSVWSGLLNLQILPPLLAAFYGTEVAGWFGLTQRVIGLPSFLVGTAIAHVYLSHVARMRVENPESVRALFDKTAKRLLLFGFVPITLIAAAGPAAFEIVFGSEWGAAGLYTRLLAPMFMAQFVAYPLSQTLNVYERQDWVLAWDVTRFFLVVGSLVAVNWLGYGPTAAVATYGVVMFVALLVAFFVARAAINRDGQAPNASIDQIK
jgi:O-antigen/teichoic acid export membrane protein